MTASRHRYDIFASHGLFDLSYSSCLIAEGGQGNHGNSVFRLRLQRQRKTAAENCHRFCRPGASRQAHKGKKGRIELEYYSEQDLETLLELLRRTDGEGVDTYGFF